MELQIFRTRKARGMFSARSNERPGLASAQESQCDSLISRPRGLTSVVNSLTMILFINLVLGLTSAVGSVGVVDTAVKASSVEKPKSSVKSENCEKCERFYKFAAEADSKGKKAADDMADYLADTDLAKEPGLRARELDAMFSAYLQLIEKDDRLQIPEYLAQIEDESPEDYKVAFNKVPASDRKRIEKLVAAAREMIKNGEPKD